MSSKQQKYYAVARGRIPGIYTEWDSCQIQVDGFTGARCKKFATEAEAKEFVKNYGVKTCSDLGINVVSPELNSGKRKVPTDAFSSGDRIANNYQTSELRPNKQQKLDDDANSVQPIIVYTDGACSNNGNKNSRAGYGVFWGDGHPDNVSEALQLNERQTNNRAEYTAVMKAIEQGLAKGIPRMIIRTDSKLLTQSLNEWIHKWKKNGWKTITNNDVINRDILERIDEMRSQIDVSFEHIPGHSGIYGNEQADKLATNGISKRVLQQPLITEKKSDNNGTSVAPIVYIGGACVDKSPTYPRAGYGVFWGYGKNSDNLCERLPSNERQKDHRALYTAVLKAVNQGIIKGFPKMIIRTDSKCATKSLTIWVNKWRNNGWRTINDQPVVNSDLLQRIDKLRTKIDFTVEHVTTGHPDTTINEFLEEANMMAHTGALKQGEFCHIDHEDSPSVSTAKSKHCVSLSKDRNTREQPARVPRSFPPKPGKNKHFHKGKKTGKNLQTRAFARNPG